ncbi:uncharacterized protein LOC144578683 [Callithrix jacchus]
MLAISHLGSFPDLVLFNRCFIFSPVMHFIALPRKLLIKSIIITASSSTIRASRNQDALHPGEVAPPGSSVELVKIFQVDTVLRQGEDAVPRRAKASSSCSLLLPELSCRQLVREPEGQWSSRIPPLNRCPHSYFMTLLSLFSTPVKQ